LGFSFLLLHRLTFSEGRVIKVSEGCAEWSWKDIYPVENTNGISCAEVSTMEAVFAGESGWNYCSGHGLSGKPYTSSATRLPVTGDLVNIVLLSIRCECPFRLN
jgi:hypothetical protein